jgi:hypothetical protein
MEIVFQQQHLGFRSPFDVTFDHESVVDTPSVESRAETTSSSARSSNTIASPPMPLESGSNDTGGPVASAAGQDSSLPGLGRLPVRRTIAVLFWAEVLAGFLVGLTLYPNWQGTIEPGQVLAGLVRYPAWNPHFRYEIQTWTLLNQLTAAALRLGADERTVTLALSGLEGAIWFAAVALVVYAVCRRPGVAFLSPFALVAARGTVIPGTTYPVMILGSPFTYGTVALALAILVLALFALNETKWAAFAAALAPAIQTSMAFWLIAVLVIAASIERDWTKRVIVEWRMWGSGAAITAASFLLQQFFRPHPIAGSEQEIVTAFIRYWDGHRHPFPLWSPATAEVVVVAALTTILFIWSRRDGKNAGLRVLAIAIIAASGIGLAVSSIYWLPIERVPRLLLALMPSRLVTIDIALGTPLTIALLARIGDAPFAAALLGLLGNAVLHGAQRLAISGWLDHFAPGWRALHELWIAVAIEAAVALSLMAALLWGRKLLVTIAIAALGASAFLALGRSIQPDVLGRYSLARAVGILLTSLVGMSAIVAWRLRWQPFSAGIERRRPPAAALTLMAVLAVFLLRASTADRPPLLDRTNDPFWSLVARHQGTIVTGAGVTSVQLRTRRPVLIDYELLDYVSFTPGAAPGMERILRGVYGADLREPPPRDEVIRADWERRSPEEWRSIGREFGATEVLVRSDWRLHLPRLATAEGLTLYGLR